MIFIWNSKHVGYLKDSSWLHYSYDEVSGIPKANNLVQAGILTGSFFYSYLALIKLN